MKQAGLRCVFGGSRMGWRESLESSTPCRSARPFQSVNVRGDPHRHSPLSVRPLWYRPNFPAVAQHVTPLIAYLRSCGSATLSVHHVLYVDLDFEPGPSHSGLQQQEETTCGQMRLQHNASAISKTNHPAFCYSMAITQILERLESFHCSA